MILERGNIFLVNYLLAIDFRIIKKIIYPPYEKIITTGLINCNLSSYPESSIVYKNLIKTIDLIGRINNIPKGLQLYIYDDGSVEKKYLIR